MSSFSYSELLEYQFCDCGEFQFMLFACVHVFCHCSCDSKLTDLFNWQSLYINCLLSDMFLKLCVM